MNLLQLRTALRARVGNPTTTEVPDTELNDRLNEAVLEIADKYGFRQARKLVTFDTVIDTQRYVLPTDLLAVMKLRHPLENLALKQRDETWASERQTMDSGKPTDYVRERDWVQLFPPPDGVYTLELKYKAIAPVMSADGDLPVTPASWDQGVLYLARAKYWDVRADLQKAIYAMNMWKDWVRDKPTEIAEELFADNTEGVVITGRRYGRTRRRDIDD